MPNNVTLLAFPGLVVLSAGLLTTAWIGFLWWRRWLEGPFPLIVAGVTLAEAVAGGFANGLVHVLTTPRGVYLATLLGFVAAFFLVPPYVMMLALLDTPLTRWLKPRAVQAGSFVFALLGGGALLLRPDVLIVGVSPRDYASYGADLTGTYRVLFVLSAALLLYGVAAVGHAVWRAKDPRARTPREKARAFAEIVLRGAPSGPGAQKHLRALFWVFTIRDLLMAFFLATVALVATGPPTSDLGIVFHYWWSPVVDIMTGGVLAWHVLSESFGQPTRRLTLRARRMHLTGWLSACLCVPLGWAIAQDQPHSWAWGILGALALVVIGAYVQEFVASALREGSKD